MRQGIASRRRFILGSTGAVAAALLAACATAAPTATPAPAKPAEPAKPAGAAKAPAPALATAAEAQAVATKPAAAAKAPAAGGQAAEVKLLTHFKPDGKTPREEALKLIFDQLKETHPNVQVKYEIIPWPEIPRKHMASHEAGNATDLIYTTAEQRFVLQGSAQALDQWVSQWPAGEKDDFVKAAWENTTFDGKQYGMPQGIFSHTLVLRKDLFDKANVDFDKPYTWDKFVEAAKTAMRDTGGKRPGEPGFDASKVQTWGFGHYKARGQGGHVTLDRTMLELGESIINVETSKANWVNDAGVQSMTMWTDMMKTDKIQSPQDLLANLDDGDNNFASGVYASYLVGNHRYGSMRQKYTFPQDQDRIVRMPTFKGEKFGPANIQQRGVFMWSGSKVKEQAWQTLDAMGGREAAVITAKVGELIPFRQSAAQHPDFLNLPPKNAHLKLLLNAISEWGFMAPQSPVNFNEHLLVAYHRIVSENISVEQALKDAAKDYDSAVEKALKE